MYDPDPNTGDECEPNSYWTSLPDCHDGWAKIQEPSTGRYKVGICYAAILIIKD